MRLLIDANILLDVLQKREPYYHDASLIWKLCETESVQGSVSALTIANLVYIMRKQLTSAKIDDVIDKLSLIFQMEDLCSSDISQAAAMQWNDFEDAIQSATAGRIHADFIITRNVRDFTKSKVAALTPAEYLARI